jgi:hypothetical protein
MGMILSHIYTDRSHDRGGVELKLVQQRERLMMRYRLCEIQIRTIPNDHALSNEVVMHRRARIADMLQIRRARWGWLEFGPSAGHKLSFLFGKLLKLVLLHESRHS